MVERKQYASLDIAKFVMAILILTQHISNEWAHSTGLVHAFFGLGNFAVPFFFACSGFLFFSKLNSLVRADQRSYYRSWSLRIGKMYLVWSLIYFCFILTNWIIDGTILERLPVFLHRSLVFSTYATIWFLPALWVGVSICYWLKNKIALRWITIVMLVLWGVGNLFGSYSNVITKIPIISSFYDWYMAVFITWRNGVFNGAPYVFLGLLISLGYGNKTPMFVDLLLTIVFGLGFCAEAFMITHYQLSSATDMGYLMLPSIFFMMNFLLKWELLPRNIFIHLRNLSMLVFLGQRLFLSAIPSVLPESVSISIQQYPQYIIYGLFIILVLVFALAVEKLSIKYKFLKVLW